MKKFIIIFLCLTSYSLNAQDNTKKENPGYKNMFKFSVTNFFDNTFQISYERMTCDNSALMISGGLSYKDNGGEPMQGYKGELQYKYFVYTREKENSGGSIYFAPYFLYKYTEKENYYHTEFAPYNYQILYYFNSFSGGILFGKNFTIAKKLVIELYVGGGIKRTFGAHLKDNVSYYNYDIWDPGYNGITPKVGIDVGFKF